LLGETLLKLDKNSDAETLLSSQDAAQLSPKGKALLGLAVARQKKTEQAKTLIGKLSLPADADAALLLTVAQLQALAGDTKTAIELLTRSLELTPPSRIEAARADISQTRDFAAIAATAEFKTALATASKVSESKCSTGKDCGSCKSKGKCSVSSKPAADPTK
jgi:tetratricopeptide (TPR) repeat protein